MSDAFVYLQMSQGYMFYSSLQIVFQQFNYEGIQIFAKCTRNLHEITLHKVNESSIHLMKIINATHIQILVLEDYTQKLVSLVLCL